MVNELNETRVITHHYHVSWPYINILQVDEISAAKKTVEMF